MVRTPQHGLTPIAADQESIFFLSQGALGTEKELAKVNVHRDEMITGDGMLLDQISKLLFCRVALFQRCVRVVSWPVRVVKVEH